MTNSATLLKFLAESPIVPEPDLVTDITAAWDAADKGTWTPAVAASFWSAYSQLCTLIKPVTVDSIHATVRLQEGRKPRTIARTTAQRFIFLLTALAVIAIGSGFITTSTAKLWEEIKELTSAGNIAATKVRLGILNIESELDKAVDPNGDVNQIPLNDPKYPASLKAKIANLRDDLQELYRTTDAVKGKVKLLRAFTPYPLPEFTPAGELGDAPYLSHASQNLTYYYQNRRSAAEAAQPVAMLQNIYAALIPVLFGCLGACTYVLRHISDQIREFTFTANSPIRHILRVGLGALAGLIVALGGFFNGTTLSGAALSFLAGYAVEPFFATLDEFAARFRRGAERSGVSAKDTGSTSAQPS